MKIFEIPGKLTVKWNAEAKAIIDTWDSYPVTLEGFEQAILKGVEYAVANGGIAWVVDSRKAKGQFSQEIQNFIVSDILPKIASIGIKYFMTINAFDDMTNLTINQYTTKVEKIGLKVVRGSSVEGAIKWLVKNG